MVSSVLRRPIAILRSFFRVYRPGATCGRVSPPRAATHPPQGASARRSLVQGSRRTRRYSRRDDAQSVHAGPSTTSCAAGQLGERPARADVVRVAMRQHDAAHARRAERDERLTPAPHRPGVPSPQSTIVQPSAILDRVAVDVVERPGQRHRHPVDAAAEGVSRAPRHDAVRSAEPAEATHERGVERAGAERLPVDLDLARSRRRGRPRDLRTPAGPAHGGARRRRARPGRARRDDGRGARGSRAP